MRGDAVSLVLNEVKQTESNEKNDKIMIDSNSTTQRYIFVLLLIKTNLPGLRKSIYRNFYNLNTKFWRGIVVICTVEAAKEQGHLMLLLLLLMMMYHSMSDRKANATNLSKFVMIFQNVINQIWFRSFVCHSAIWPEKHCLRATSCVFWGGEKIYWNIIVFVVHSQNANQ